MSRMIDLSQLPPPEAVETIDYEELLAEYRADFRSRFPEILDEDLESEPVGKTLEAGAYRETLVRQRINDAALGLLLAKATGANLDQLLAGLGAIRLEGESDDAFRARGQLSLEGLSVAGPREGYRFFALGADAEVKDVAIDSPTPGDVAVTVLSHEGNGAPDQALLDAVEAALSAETVRPLCDRVSVAAAAIVEYAVNAALTIDAGPDAATVLAAATASVQAAVDAAHRLGRGAPLSAIYGALHVAGVNRVNLIAPAADVAVTAVQAAYCTNIDVTQA